MKKFTFILSALLIAVMSFAQFQANPKVSPFLEELPSSAKAPVTTLAYCSDVVDANIGFGAANDFIVLAQFPAATMATYTGNFVNQIQIGVNPSNITGDITVGVWTDTTGNFASTPAASETVAVSSLVDGWNTITLTTPYSIDGSQIWVGYVVSSLDYGLYMDDIAYQADGYGDIIFDGTEWGLIHDYGVAGLDGNWHIKAVVDDGASFVDVSVSNLTAPNSGCEVGANEELVATVVNLGSDDITDAFDIAYAINNDYGNEVAVAVPVPLAAGASVDVTFNLDFSVDGAYLIEAYCNYAADVDLTNDTAMNAVINTLPIVIDATGYSNDFQENEDFLGIGIVDNNADGSTWDFFIETDPNIAAAYEYNSTNAGDDYLVLNCMDFTAGDYVVGFDYKVQSASYPEGIKAVWGTSPDPADLTNEIVSLTNLTNTDFETSAGNTFTITTDGTYYIAFVAISDADMWILWLDNITVEMAVGVESTIENTVSVYPNPANNVINVANAENSSIVVLNMVGEVVATIDNASANQTIDISNLADGTYFVRVNSEVFKINVVK